MTDVKVMPELARALRDGGHYSPVMPELNIYYMDYYPASVIKSSMIKQVTEIAKNARRIK